ncbi:4Fe-4S dicluster domain-containing protein [Geoglobus acetivorans]|uniref:4Fe-4S dicluster domain-containing protein n=1 Tax=Geoglobus acetivorans TaxID=565033 RepID=A0ABZ3H012_GEOAI|nr:4Fe-4S dicluster domain-containing protein [Geoglobus acetivorans]
MVSRRKFLAIIAAVAGFASFKRKVAAQEPVEGYDWNKHKYAFVVDTTRCIGCGRCVRACKIENEVPMKPFYFRTWVERWVWLKDEEGPKVDSPNGGFDGFPPTYDERMISKSYYVPKLCNHCDRPPCVQVCPVGATYKTKDGVVLVDEKYCIGCRYCIQACPYGARYLYPADGPRETRRNTADKCTWCYHRITRGYKPACVEVCPVGARKFGDLMDPEDEVRKIIEERRVQVLKPDMGTLPQVYYIELDSEVR